MDTNAGDLTELIEVFDLTNILMVGHSTAGGERGCYIGRHRTKRAANDRFRAADHAQHGRESGWPADVGLDGNGEGVRNNCSQFCKDLGVRVLRLRPS
jgi:non-heme chloroperoxidase